MPGQRALLLAFLGAWLPLLEGARILTVVLYGEWLLGCRPWGTPPAPGGAARSPAESVPWKARASLELRAGWAEPQPEDQVSGGLPFFLNASQGPRRFLQGPRGGCRLPQTPEVRP